MTWLLCARTHADAATPRKGLKARALRVGGAGLVAGGLLVGTVGCAVGPPVNLDAEDQKVAALVEELQPVAAAQLETLGKESLGSIAGWASIYQPPGGEDTSVGILSGYDQGQEFSAWGMCTGVEGTLPVEIGNFGAYELDCAPADEGLSLQLIAEDLVVERDTIEFTVTGAPRGSAWHLEAVDRG